MTEELPQPTGDDEALDNLPVNQIAAAASSDYDASQIRALKGIEGIRTRPAMYIGDTTPRGLHHLVYEVVDNSVDEAVNGFATSIFVRLHADGSVSCSDDGRGIPVDDHPKFPKKSALEVIMTTLHSGGKFDSKVYNTSGGLHGVGVSVVNALSEWFEVEVSRGGQVHHMKFERGKTVKKLEVIGKARGTGTLITFKPDAEIFRETTVFQGGRISQRLRELAQRHELIGDVRGLGLTLGVELVKNRQTRERATDEAEQVMYRALDKGLSFKLTMGNILLLTPPLIITPEQIQEIFEKVARLIRAVP